MRRLPIVLALLSFSATAYSEGSPWLPEDGVTNLGVTVITGSSDDFFLGDESINLNGDLSGTFVWLDASYGYDDVWAFDARVGYAETEFVADFAGANPDTQEDIADTSFGVSYQFINEFEADNGLPTIAARLGVTIGGDYDPNVITALGDGASGADLSLLVGKSLTSEFSASGDLTLRQRGSGVPNAIKILLSGQYASPIPNLGFQLSYAGIRTDSDLNLGETGISFDQFQQIRKDTDWLIVGANYGFGDGFGAGFSYASLLSGRNVADTDIATFNFGYSF